MAHADLSDDGSLVEIQTTWNEKELVRQLPGVRWGPVLGLAEHWYAPLTWATCVTLRGIFGQTITVSDRLNQWAWEERQGRVDPLTTIRLATEPSHETELNGLYPFQSVGTDFFALAGDCLLGDEMGTGKTVQVLAAMKNIGVDKTLPALVVCPNSVKRHWRETAKRWLSDANVYIIEGSSAQKLKILKSAMSDSHALVVVNFESTRTLSRLAPHGSIRLRRCRECDRKNGEEGLKVTLCQVHPKPLNTLPVKLVIIDEAHRIKDPNSQQTRATWALMHGETVRRRWALTGTPLANHPGDLWSIMHGVSPSEYPTKSKFIDRYALTGWNRYGSLDIVGLRHETKEEFYRIFDPRFRRMPKALVLAQLPPKVRVRRTVEMTPKQARAYRELEDSLVTRLDDGTLLVARGDFTAQIRLLQFSSSYVTVDGDRVTLCEPSPKLDALEEILDELGDRQVAVCAQSRQLIYLAAARLTKRKTTYGLITGAQKEWERDNALRDFQDGKLQVMLFTLQAGGTGLTMTAADTIVFLQRSWSMIDNRQAEDRVHRIGSEIHESITVIDVVTDGTVEVSQLDRLDDKMARLQEITRDRAILTARGHDTAELDALELRLTQSNLGLV